MAIFHVQPLLVLLASLFFLPTFALRVVDFEYCKESGYDLGRITRVEVSTTPIKIDDEDTISIIVYGSTNNASKYIDKGYVEVTYFDGVLLNIYDLCKVIACPIKPGTNFVLALSKVIYSQGFVYNEEKYAVTMFGDKRREIMCVSIKAPSYTAPSLVSA